MTVYSEATTSHFPLISDCILQGYDDWMQDVSDRGRVVAHSRTRSSFTHDCIMKRIRDRAPDVPGLDVENIGGLDCLLLGGETIARIKKLDRNAKPSNIMTQQQEDYYAGQLAFLPLTPLIIGYQQDSLQMSIRRIRVLFYDRGRQSKWEDIYTAQDVGKTSLFDKLTETAVETPDVPVPRVVPRQRPDIASNA